jgi:hypothetical protein
MALLPTVATVVLGGHRNDGAAGKDGFFSYV